MAIFGDNGTKSGGTSLNKTSVKCRQFTIPENGNLTQISFFYSTSPTSDTYNTKVFIYADNGSNSPGALLGSAYGPQISQNFPGSWVNVDVSVSGLTAGSKYWLGWINDAPSGISTFFWSHSSGSGGTGKYKSVSDGYASTPNPYGTPTGDTPNTYLIYGTYTPTGGGGVTVTPSAFNLASAILAPVVSVQKQITISPNALGASCALLVPSLKTGITIAPGVITLGSELHAPLVNVKNDVLILPQALSIIGALEEAGLGISSKVFPEALALVSFLFAPWVDDPAKRASLAMDAEIYDSKLKAIVED